MVREALPAFYTWVLSYINPLITFVGVIFCVLTPYDFFLNRLPPTTATHAVVAMEKPRLLLLVYPLGQGYLTLVVLALLITRFVKNESKTNPEMAEKVARIWILVTLLPEPLTLGAMLSALPGPFWTWAGGDVFQFVFTSLIATVKISWLLGIGRPVIKRVKTK